MGTQDIKITPRTGGTTGVPEILFQGSGNHRQRDHHERAWERGHRI